MRIDVEVALLGVTGGSLGALLIVKGREAELPAASPGTAETLDAAAARLLAKGIGLADVFLEQLYTFSRPGKSISVAYYALVDEERLGRAKGLLARIIVPWEGETGGPVEVVDAQGRAIRLGAAHATVLGTAVKRIRGKLGYTPIGFQLLPATFTLRQLQDVHEAVLGRPLNKDSFRRRMLASGQLEATGEREEGVEHRPAEHYRFARRSAI
jgi:8-oxo-dGTP diphosphatase